MYPRNRLRDTFPVIQTVDDVRSAIKWVESHRYSVSTKQTYKHFIKELWSESHDITSRKGWAPIEWELKKWKIGSRPKSFYSFISAGTLSKLIKNANSERHVLYMRFLYETGFRVGEMVEIKMSDCRSTQNGISVRVISKKTYKNIYRTIPRKLFSDIRKEFYGKNYLFETIDGQKMKPDFVSRCIRTVGRRIGVDISAHSFRHSYITRRTKNGDDLTLISRDVGHINVGSTFDNYYHSEAS